MSSPKGQKLKKLLSFPPDLLLSASQLKRTGISPKLAGKYIKSGWLERVARGIYKRKDEKPSVEGLLHCLQYGLGLDVHLGARSALSLSGISHYLGERERVYIFGKRLPSWVFSLGFEVINIRTEKWSRKEFMFFHGGKPYKFYIARRELAILQQIELVGKRESFSETALLFELLQDLNVEVLKKILPIATEKARRIFLFFAEIFRPPWASYFKDMSKEISSSVITVEREGKFIRKYRLIIPEDFHV